MARIFVGVRASPFSEKGELRDSSAVSFRLEICSSVPKVYLKLTNGADVRNIMLGKDAQMASVGASSAIVSSQAQSYILHFTTPKDVKTFLASLKDIMNPNSQSIFEQRTDSTSAEQYFQFYGYLSQQQNMMQDYIRTSTYQRAMLENSADFIDKVVLDVGAGSGILSFFAIQAGAAKVYAVEASNMAAHCETLVRANRLQDRITVLAGKIEEVQLPEMVDIIISEPMGYMLLNERMLETYLHAKKWLKPGGKMFPTQGDLYMAPFTDDALYMEQFSKANFWCQPCFHGVDLSSIRHAAVKEYFKQPIVDTFDVRICTAAPLKHVIDFSVAHETDLHDINMPLTFNVQQSGTIHGIAFWFEVAFLGSQNSVILSTAPTQPLTHWYQVRCLLESPIFARQGQVLEGKVHLRANTRQSYDVDIELGIVGSGVVSSNTLDLKNPFFRYTGQQPLPPPGTNNASPTELYWAQQEAAAAQQMQVANGYYVNGGAVGYVDNTQQQQPLLPAAPPTMAAPVNPGSIPAATLSSHSAASQALHSRTSIGGGLSPTVFGQTVSTVAGLQYPVSSQFMIGDYVNLFTGTGGADQVIAPQQTTFKTATGGLH